MKKEFSVTKETLEAFLETHLVNYSQQKGNLWVDAPAVKDGMLVKIPSDNRFDTDCEIVFYIEDFTRFGDIKGKSVFVFSVHPHDSIAYRLKLEEKKFVQVMPDSDQVNW